MNPAQDQYGTSVERLANTGAEMPELIVIGLVVLGAGIALRIVMKHLAKEPS